MNATSSAVDRGDYSHSSEEHRAARVERLIVDHGAQIMGIARSYSQCAADADDAFQHAVEKLITKAPNECDEQLVSWLKVVVRNEALMIHRANRRRDPGEFEEIAEHWVADAVEPETHVLGEESLGQGREALSKLSPAQVRCLLLRADGLGYPEICKITGFSYAKVNRCLSEGRKMLRTQAGMIAAGASCSRLEPALSQYADDAADEATIEELEIHLDHCLACQATLRDYRAAPKTLSSLFPVGGAVLLEDHHRGAFSQAFESVQGFLGNVMSRIVGHAEKFTSGSEVAVAKKATALAAISTSLVVGGAAIHQSVDDGGNRWGASQISLGADASNAAEAVPTRDRRAHKRKHDSGKGSNGRQVVSTAAVARSVTASQQNHQAEPLNQMTADDDQTFASDPADGLPTGSGIEQSERGGLAP